MERDYTNALAWYRKALEEEPHYAGAYGSIGETYQAMGDYTNAIDNYKKGELLRGDNEAEVEQRYNDLRRALENEGVLGYWEQWWKWAEQNPDDGFYWKAVIQIHMGNTNAAFDWLDKSF